MRNFFKEAKIANRKRGHAFTLAEMMAVLVIISILAAIAVPRYQMVVEKVRSAEGINALTAILEAEKRWALENVTYTTTMANLDITVTGLQNFNNPILVGPPAVGGNGEIASIQRNGVSPYDYILHITERTGTLSCTGGAGSICTKIQSW